MKALTELRAAVSFLTPLGRTGTEPSAATMTYFPLVGAALGALVGLTWRLASRSFPPALSAALDSRRRRALTGPSTSTGWLTRPTASWLTSRPGAVSRSCPNHR